jgi:hypothetical protein
MSGFEVLEELWERVLTSLSAQSLVSAAVSPVESAQIYWLSSTLSRYSFQHPVFDHSSMKEERTAEF